MGRRVKCRCCGVDLYIESQDERVRCPYCGTIYAAEEEEEKASQKRWIVILSVVVGFIMICNIGLFAWRTFYSTTPSSAEPTPPPDAQAAEAAIAEAAAIATPTASAPTSTPVPPTAMPTATAIATDTPTPSPTPVKGKVTADTPSRDGPGTEYWMAGEASKGMEVKIDARSPDGKWLREAPPYFLSPHWLRSDHVDLEVPIETIPIAQDIPTPPPTETPSPYQAEVKTTRGSGIIPEGFFSDEGWIIMDMTNTGCSADKVEIQMLGGSRGDNWERLVIKDVRALSVSKVNGKKVTHEICSAFGILGANVYISCGPFPSGEWRSYRISFAGGKKGRYSLEVGVIFNDTPVYWTGFNVTVY